MFEQIYDKIEKYENIVIVRHIGADPDALASQLALRDSIRLTFPDKEVFAVGTTVSRFKYFGKVDKVNKYDYENALLIVLDTPDNKRVDFAWNIQVSETIKVDHHPYIESFCNIESIDDTATSASELILELIMETPLKLDGEISKTLYYGIISDTNRFMFNANTKIFKLVSELLKYSIDTLYSKDVLE